MDLNDAPQIKYEGDEWQRRMRSFQLPQKPKIVQWVIDYSGGLIRNDAQAQYLLIAFVGLIFLASFIFLRGSFSNDIQDETREIIEKAIEATDAPR